MKYRVYNIVFDTELEDLDLLDEDNIHLPSEIIVQSNRKMTEDELSDYISDTYGYCHEGFSYEEI